MGSSYVRSIKSIPAIGNDCVKYGFFPNMPDNLHRFNFLYLHGFASGPQSAKAQFFREQFSQLGIELHIPDLNAPDFSHMTLTSQHCVIEETVAKLKDKPLVIWGSSLGGLLALQFAQGRDAVKGLILLAPALELSKRWERLLGRDGLERWATRGEINTFHHAYKKELPLSYDFYTDAKAKETDNLPLVSSAIIFHGLDDQTVPIDVSRRFSQKNTDRVQLIELRDGHELVSTKWEIWSNAASFIKSLP
jgi:uncharacterized protein